MCAPLLHFHTRSLFYLSEKKRASTDVARTSQALVLFLVVHAKEAPTFPYHIIHSLIHSRNVFLSTSYFPGPVIGTRDEAQDRPTRASPPGWGHTREQTVHSMLEGLQQQSVQSAVGPGLLCWSNRTGSQRKGHLC